MKKYLWLILLAAVLLCSSAFLIVSRQREAQAKDSEETAEGGALLTDFHVQATNRELLTVTDEEAKKAAELIRMYSFVYNEDHQEGELAISQPLAFLNYTTEHRQRDVFLFRDGVCCGVMSFGHDGDEYSSGFGPLDSPELTRLLAEETPFVLITDLMRLWFVTEEGSYPMNLKELEGEGPPWLPEYAEYAQVIKLTPIGS